MIAIRLGCAALGAAATQIPKVVNHFKKQEEIPTPEEVKVAEKALKKGIEEYDESHPENNIDE